MVLNGAIPVLKPYPTSGMHAKKDVEQQDQAKNKQDRDIAEPGWFFSLLMEERYTGGTS
jgi:hypothetical protein